MFLKKMISENSPLVELAFSLHQQGQVLPDSYLIDVDTFKENAIKILNQANQQNIDLYFMLKQVGRNPYLAKLLVALGYKGAVVVDFKEALVMMKHHIPISNVGHLVQPPKQLLQQLVDYNCEYFTVFSIDKIKDINACAKKANKIQKIMLKIVGEEDLLYSGQIAGFKIEELEDVIKEVKELSNVTISGITSFPCFLYDEDLKKIKALDNLYTLLKADELLQEWGITIDNINAPSTTCVETLKLMKQYKINSAEPGHGLSGTTPMHAYEKSDETPCVLYLSEVSHNFDDKGYCYGGGFYRRSHMAQALVGPNLNAAKPIEVDPLDLESIDYYFTLNKQCKVNDTVIMAFRFQIFVTRSNVVLIEGLSQNKPKVIGNYDSLGSEINYG